MDGWMDGWVAEGKAIVWVGYPITPENVTGLLKFRPCTV